MSVPGERSYCLYTPSRDASGMREHMLDLTAELVAGADVSFMAWANDAGVRLLDRAAALGATPVPLPHPRAPSFGATVEAFLRRRPTDVFHVHVGFGRENFDGARAARRAGVGAIVQTVHLPWLLGSHKHRVPFFAALDPVDHVVTVSEAQRRTYERIGVPPYLMTTIPNGVRPRAARPGRDAARAALGLRPDQPVVLATGRLVVMKGHRYLVDAVPALVRRFPDVAVVVLGEGHLRETLAAQAAALGVGRHVHLAGHRADARALLDAADVFVLPSLHEGMPLVLLEAMEAGRPVVATRVIGSAEVVADGRTGLLVRPKDADALGAAVTRLLGDDALRERLGRAGRQCYLDRFTSARMASDTRDLYERMLRWVAPDARPAS